MTEHWPFALAAQCKYESSKHNGELWFMMQTHLLRGLAARYSGKGLHATGHRLLLKTKTELKEVIPGREAEQKRLQRSGTEKLHLSHLE